MFNNNTYPQQSQSNQKAANSASPKKDTAKLSTFLNDCMAAGCLKGFQYFELYLRGKEELICRVYANKNSQWMKPAQAQSVKPTGKPFLSQRTNKMLFDQEKVAPASPCDRELEKDSEKTAFLIAGYARYHHPFVWLRSNHQRMLQLKIEQNLESDNPIKLNSTSEWSNKDIRLSDILEEIVNLAMVPPPKNPFEINHSHFDSLPVSMSVVLTGALLDFLQKIYVRSPEYAAEVLEDIRKLQQRHFVELFSLVGQKQLAGNPPVVKSSQQ